MSAQGQALEAEPTGRQDRSFVIVYPGYHRQWATWIHRALERLGCQVVLQRWGPPREQPLEEALGDLLLADGVVLLVLSEWFFELGPRKEGEWDAAMRGFVAEHRERFAAVNVTSPALPTSAAVARPVELWGVSADEAVRRLLNRLEVDVDPAEMARAGAGHRYPRDTPDVWGEVPRRNADFTGRDELLNSLQQRLMDAERGTAAVALVGMPGIGKSAIAAEYAHRFSSDYDVVWWVNSDARGTLRERFSELAPRLGLPAEAGGSGGRIRALREALRRGEPYNRWLIIFDGWDDLSDAGTLLPEGDGHVLITSRNRSWSRHTDIVTIPQFVRGESTGYLMRRAPSITAEEADQVAVELEDVPLALSQAAAWLSQSEMAVDEYLRMTRQRGGIDLPAVLEAAGDYPIASLTSWSILINQLRKDNPRAVQLLILCTVFAPGRIPLGLVRAVPESELPEELRWIVRDRAAWTQALDVLTNFSVVNIEPVEHLSAGRADGGEDRVRMHRLVHTIAGQLTATDDLEEYRRIVRRGLAEADPGTPHDSRSWPVYSELLLHIEPSGALTSTGNRVRRTVLNCVEYCALSAEYTTGVTLAAQVREQWKATFPPSDPMWVPLTVSQSLCLRESGQIRAAHELIREQLASLDEMDAPDVAGVLSVQHSLAIVLRRLGRYGESLELSREILEEAQQALGRDHASSLALRTNLGVALRQLGRYEEAYEIDVETMRRRERVLPARDQATLVSGNNCAYDLRLMGKFSEALARQELGMQMHIQVLGPDHAQTLFARHQLLLCRYRAGEDREEIREQLAFLLDRLRQVYGRTFYLTLNLVTDYGNFLREVGDTTQAGQLISEAEEGYRRLLGQAHPVPTGMQSSVGLNLRAEGDTRGALNLFEQAYFGLRTLLGPDHPWTLGCALNSAAGRQDAGRGDEAAELGKDTLDRARRTLGEDHLLTLSVMSGLATDLRSLGEETDSGKLDEAVLSGLTRTLGMRHPQTVSIREGERPLWDFEPNLG
ncbi:FxSxx-COOH system tetratricopeptide repeat protein [Streptomyces sp. WMMB 322]|uniref:FxSxx-COOH system tetratricopeptide repeat protein n=1 Tax=Streptomyces sp. WMMB 322 TaxID=1286821 RepID=UPI0006E32F7E|nr:FxSxx-COOH system tetratricopeptide repeat protein [Streptomyces sp. WMMB 322]